MSDDDDNFSIGAPLFNADNALEQIKRALRDMKLSARGNAFELRGKAVVQLEADAGSVHTKLARKPAFTPEWDNITVKTSADQRKLLDEVKKRLARWTAED
jgi:hypothetical protein